MSDSDDWITLEQAAEFMRSGTGRGVKIAVLDTGIDTTHPSLAGVRLLHDHAYEEVYEPTTTLETVSGNNEDFHGHGTAVADIIHRVAPEAEIGSFHVLVKNTESRTEIVARGAVEAIDRGYSILNCSFGCNVPEHALRYKSWVDMAYLKNVHVVAAGSSVDPREELWPGFFTSVISVDVADLPDENDLYYKRDSVVEFYAHAVNLKVAWSSKLFRHITGSSFAAARVTGLLARLLSEAPHLTPCQAKAILHRIARPWPPAAGEVSYREAPPPQSLFYL